MKNYSGGDNPLVAIIFLVLISFLILTGIVYLIIQAYNIFQFNRICTQSKLTGEEIGFIRTFINRLHIKQPLDIVSRRVSYDTFVNSVAHFYESQNISEEDLLHETQLFDRVREKLNFKHKYKRKNILSSRALPENHPVFITYINRETKQIYTFDSHVILNSDFYLGIAPPTEELDPDIVDLNQAQPILEVCFRRPQDDEYLFDSTLVRPVTFPKNLWYIRHSERIVKGDPMKQLDIPGTIMITHAEDCPNSDTNNLEEAAELSVSIQALNNRACLFKLSDENLSLTPHMRILLTFEVNKSPLTIRAEIKDKVSSKKGTLYQSTYKDLAQEDFLSITSFIVLKKSNKKTGAN